MFRLIHTPSLLHKLARESEAEGRDVVMKVEDVKNTANAWFEDQKKIQYLESLLLRKGQ